MAAATPETKSKEMVNVKIRIINGPETDFTDVAATSKYFFGDKYKALLPRQILSLPKSYVDNLFSKREGGSYLEVTEEDPTLSINDLRKYRSAQAQK